MGELHHLSVGCADASVIKAGAIFLVDCHRIDEHAVVLPRDKHIRGVFVTHQHRDHYSGLQYLKDNGYSIDCLIYSPYERRRGDSSVTIEEWDEFTSLADYFAGNGTMVYKPFRQDSFDKPYWDTNGVRFWLLGPLRATAESDTRHLHDACLVIKADLGNRKCLFTGDASDINLQDVSRINHICDDILHASHHGSIEGANLDFIKRCNAEWTVISTESGVHENVPHPTALRRYQDHTKCTLYRTDEAGSLRWTF